MNTGETPYTQYLQLGSLYLDDIERVLRVLDNSEYLFDIEVGLDGIGYSAQTIPDLLRFRNLDVESIIITVFTTEKVASQFQLLTIGVDRTQAWISVSDSHDATLLDIRTRVLKIIGTRRLSVVPRWIYTLGVLGYLVMNWNISNGNVATTIGLTMVSSIFWYISLRGIFRVFRVRKKYLVLRKYPVINWSYSHEQSSWLARNRDILIASFSAALGALLTLLVQLLGQQLGFG